MWCINVAKSMSTVKNTIKNIECEICMFLRSKKKSILLQFKSLEPEAYNTIEFGFLVLFSSKSFIDSIIFFFLNNTINLRNFKIWY